MALSILVIVVLFHSFIVLWLMLHPVSSFYIIYAQLGVVCWLSVDCLYLWIYLWTL